MVERLDDAEIRKRVAELEGWHVDGGHLWKTFTFHDFVEAIGFVNAVAEVAEDYEHHPDIHLHWNEVSLEVWTHEAGGLTEWDFELAALIDEET